MHSTHLFGAKQSSCYIGGDSKMSCHLLGSGGCLYLLGVCVGLCFLFSRSEGFCFLQLLFTSLGLLLPEHGGYHLLKPSLLYLPAAVSCPWSLPYSSYRHKHTHIHMYVSDFFLAPHGTHLAYGEEYIMGFRMTGHKLE